MVLPTLAAIVELNAGVATGPFTRILTISPVISFGFGPALSILTSNETSESGQKGSPPTIDKFPTLTSSCA